MRLINISTFRLVEFSDERNFNFAILSHRWEQEEVLFRHMSSGDVLRSANTMKGFYNIQM